MNNFGNRRSGSCGRRRWRQAAAVLLVGAALLAAGCGSATAGGQAAESSAYQKALPFAQCMRSHGIGNFPDPDSNGNFDGSNIQDTPQYAAAQSTCVKLHPYNMVLSPNQVEQMMSLALKFSRCMRAHGVPNFPDPTDSGGGISFGGQTSGGSPPGQGGSSPATGSGGHGGDSGSPSSSTAPRESPQYRAASHACQRYAGKGVK